MTGFVYFVDYPDSDWVKIGYAKEVTKRLSQLRVASPEDLQVVAAIPGTFADEQSLHAALSGHARRREWFKKLDLIPAIIERAKAFEPIAEIIAWASAENAALIEAQELAKYHRLLLGWVIVANNPRQWDHNRVSARDCLLEEGRKDLLTEEAALFVPRPYEEYSRDVRRQFEVCRQTKKLSDLLRPKEEVAHLFPVTVP